MLDKMIMQQYSFFNVDLKLGMGPKGGETLMEAIRQFSTNNGTITVGRTANQHIKVVGGYGELNVVTDSDLTGFVSFTLLQTSDWNEVLYRWANVTQSDVVKGRNNLTKGKFVPIQGEMVDITLGNSVVSLTDGFISRRPVVTRGQMTNEVTWTIDFGVVNFEINKHLDLLENFAEDVKNKLTDDSSATA